MVLKRTMKGAVRLAALLEAVLLLSSLAGGIYSS